MRRALLQWLVCPDCHGRLTLSPGAEADDEIASGSLECGQCRRSYAIERGIPRFVDATNYTSNFGFQWNRFARTQLDSANGTTISRDRFIAQTGWTADTLRDHLVLDCGCGSGRFAEIALSLGATVVAVDYSTAVDACRENLGHHSRLHLIQGDLYRLPFAEGTFDAVYSLGVLQHTPDVARAFASVARQARPGGSIVVDVYPRTWKDWLHPRTWLRPMTVRMPHDRLFASVERSVPTLLKISQAVGRVPVIGRVLKRAVPVANYTGVYPLTDAQLREWAVLDTFDWLGPRYDTPQTAETLRAWAAGADLEEVAVFQAYHLTARGRRRAAVPDADRDASRN